MKLNHIFLNPVDRRIEGVIKADDDTSLYLELSEYVLTNEVSKRLEEFLDAYNNYHGANGVWISGFFGSGKSHLLKMLALLLENRAINENSAIDLFLPKIAEDNILLKAALKKAISIPSKSILFNIDQKAEIISKSQIDALLSVFVKVFNEMCGYFGKQGYIAQFERDLDSRNQFNLFKDAYQAIAQKTWERGREQALLESGNIAKAYSQITGEDLSLAKGILEKYRAQYSVSIEDFSNQVKSWLDKQAPNFRLNFFVDEVGQYIADNTKLMTNLQTVAESLATKCQGRAWILVTAQEDMNSVLGDMSKQQSNDFTKIQARFANRLKLTSADVAEVIQKRLLSKNAIGTDILKTVYGQQVNNFRTLFEFTDDTQKYQNFRDQTHFTYCYPFVPYQFPLFQSAIRGLSQHNGFEGKANSVGERSMLGVFREVAIAINNESIGQLATFDRMFEGIRNALKSAIQSAINNAERNFDNPYAVRVLKALFLVKYVKEFKATARNLSVLMLESFDEDISAQRKKLASALNDLEKQTYIQRHGDIYEYLTDEEKDIEEEIKNTEIESADVSKQLEELFFDGIIKQRKIRYSNGQDYPYSRKMDERLLSREHELSIHFITPLNENIDNIALQNMHSMGRDELRVVLPADIRFMQDVLMYKRTEKYIRQNSNTQQEAIKRILDAKGFQNTERLAELQIRAKNLLGQAHLIINAHDIDISSNDGQTRIIMGFHKLIESSYPNLRMLRSIEFQEKNIGDFLKKKNNSLLSNDATNLSEAEQEILSFIQSNARHNSARITVKGLVERFERKNYGWYYAAILCNLALLYARGKIDVLQDSNSLESDALEKLLCNQQAHASLILEPQIEFSARQINTLKNFFSDFFDRPAKSNDALALAKETTEALNALIKELTELYQQRNTYPFLNILEDALYLFNEIAKKKPNWFLTELSHKEDSLLDTKEQIINPLRRFMNSPQREIYDQAHLFLREQQNNFTYINSTVVEVIREMLNDKKPWQGNKLQHVRQHLDVLQQAVAGHISHEQHVTAHQISELEQRLCCAAGYNELNTEQRTQLIAPFMHAREAVHTQHLIAVLREQRRQAEEEIYPNALLKLEALTHLTSTSVMPSSQTTTPAPTPRSIPARKINVGYAKPWISNEADLEDYLQKQREAWLREIRAGNRVQI